MPERTYPCCDCCAADLPHIERDTHTLPCDICHPSPVELARRAMAWDEGYVASAIDANSGSATPNPYRAKENR